ncbi:MAG: carbon monoxide dehydrogenase [Alphaproteobacteria bacterium]|nr:MAG: carbon monoxide dehydrogenase [Alphaproteobacteria bacterium]
MELTGQYKIPAPRDAVWQALNSEEVLAKCIPGCESLEKQSDTAFTATVQAKIGPVKAKFKGKVDLKDLNPPESYRIEGQGSGGPAGFAKGGAQVTLAEDGDATALVYNVDAQVGGKLAQIGQRLIDASAKKLADEFFQNLSDHFGAREEEVAPAAAPQGLPPLIWATTLIVATLLLLAFLAT